jgi:competence protein ComEC
VANYQKVALHPIQTSARLNFDSDCYLDLLNPESLNIPPDENNSLLARLDCHKQSYLFSGDNSIKVEKALIASGWNLEAAVLKASHHGSNSASSLEFLQVVNPSFFIISAGLNNRYGHPHPDILNRVLELGIKLWRTDISGSLKFSR